MVDCWFFLIGFGGCHGGGCIVVVVCVCVFFFSCNLWVCGWCGGVVASLFIYLFFCGWCLEVEGETKGKGREGEREREREREREK